LPIIQGGQREPHPELFFEHEGGAALIQGDYKLVRLAGNNQVWELNDLASDRTETKNVASTNAARTMSMTATWQAWYGSVAH
jgi:arylsulfatase A-like enzyme